MLLMPEDQRPPARKRAAARPSRRPQPAPARTPLRQPQLGPAGHRLQALLPGDLEALADARFDVHGPDDHNP